MRADQLEVDPLKWCFLKAPLRFFTVDTIDKNEEHQRDSHFYHTLIFTAGPILFCGVKQFAVLDGHTCATKYPRATGALRVSFNGCTGRPIYHKANISTGTFGSYGIIP